MCQKNMQNASKRTIEVEGKGKDLRISTKQGISATLTYSGGGGGGTLYGGASVGRGGFIFLFGCKRVCP